MKKTQITGITGQDGSSRTRLPFGDASTLAASLDRLAAVRALVIGDAMLDRYVYGAVERISPEAPIPVFLETRETAMAGGAGNVVRNLAAFGVPTGFVSVVG